jgi:hypothetical protein
MVKIVMRVMCAASVLPTALYLNAPVSWAFGDAPWCAVKKSWKRRRVLGLPIPHVRSVLSERLSRSRLLQRKPVARPDYYGVGPETSKNIFTRALGLLGAVRVDAPLVRKAQRG